MLYPEACLSKLKGGGAKRNIQIYNSTDKQKLANLMLSVYGESGLAGVMVMAWLGMVPESSKWCHQLIALTINKDFKKWKSASSFFPFCS